VSDEENQLPDDPWVRLEAHASSMMAILNSLIESTAAAEGRVPDDLAQLYDAFDPVWRSIQSRLFPD
jgi:hypothetical protein